MKCTGLHIIFCFVVIISCNNKTDINVPQQTPVLVINSQIQQLQTFTVKLTRSRNVLDPRDTTNLLNTYTVKGASVIIKENNVIVDSLKYDSINYRYISTKNKKTVIGNTYEINASANGFVNVQTTSIQPTLVKNNSVQFNRSVQTNAGGVLQDAVTVTFTDDGTKTDYYLFRIHKSDGSYADCVNTTDADIETLVNDDPFSIDKCLDGNKLLYSDKNFNGKTKTIVFYVQHTDMANLTLPTNNTRRPWIELLHITQDYFNYIKSVNNYDISQANPFAEPANIFSNVKNGYGFFTCYTFSVDTLK